MATNVSHHIPPAQAHASADRTGNEISSAVTRQHDMQIAQAMQCLSFHVTDFIE